MVDAVVLAAGAGRRIGRPKALLESDGVTYLERVVTTCRAGGCSRIWVAIRADVPEIAALVERLVRADAGKTPRAQPGPSSPGESRSRSFQMRTIVNPDPERGMFSSVHAVLGEALTASRSAETRVRGAASPDGFLLFPVDHPWVAAKTVATLLSVASSTGSAWIRPVFEDRGGHPVFVNRATAVELQRFDPEIPLRDALRAAGVAPVSVPVEDPAVLRNVNHPRDLS